MPSNMVDSPGHYGTPEGTRELMSFGYPYVWLHWKIDENVQIDIRFTARSGFFPVNDKKLYSAFIKSI